MPRSPLWRLISMQKRLKDGLDSLYTLKYTEQRVILATFLRFFARVLLAPLKSRRFPLQTHRIRGLRRTYVDLHLRVYFWFTRNLTKW